MIHGRRRPIREEVRSENAPAYGLKSIAATAPRPLTQASAGTDPVITGEQGRDLLAFSQAAQRSAAEGVRTEVTPGPPPPATT